MNYYLGRKGEKLGPYTLAQLQTMMAQGQVFPDDLAWGEGMPSWLPAVQVLGSAGHPIQQPVAPVLPSAGTNAYPMPPNMHWAVVFLLSIFTCGIFGLVWLFIEANFVKKLDPRSKGVTMFALYLGLYFVGIITGVVGAFASDDLKIVGSLFSALAYIGALVCMLIGVFDMRKSLETHYNSVEPMGLKLRGVMTFFFHFLYFQYHFSRIATYKQTGVLPA